MDSIFDRLFRYRPSSDRLPQEDFFTEALVGVLRASPALAEAFASWLIGEELDQVALQSQKTVGKNRIDIWIDARNRRRGIRHAVAVENKIGAGEGEDQLLRYESQLKCDAGAHTRTLVYATLHERSGFKPGSDSPRVRSRQIHWFEVADWMRKSLANPNGEVDERCIVFLRELLLLMEHWNMTMNLNAGDLATATTYKRSVEDQLIQILDETYAACQLPGTRDNQWSYVPRYSRRVLCYSSPWIDDHQDIYVEFGFDFDRHDVDWNVDELRLPSAYFAVRGTTRPSLDSLSSWGAPPDSWDSDYLLVKQLPCLRVGGDSLHVEYLNFLQDARDELWRAVGLV